MRAISREELTLVSGGRIIEGDGSHGVKQHVPGRLGPDESEMGTIAGAGLEPSEVTLVILAGVPQ